MTSGLQLLLLGGIALLPDRTDTQLSRTPLRSQVHMNRHRIRMNLSIGWHVAQPPVLLAIRVLPLEHEGAQVTVHIDIGAMARYDRREGGQVSAKLRIAIDSVKSLKWRPRSIDRNLGRAIRNDVAWRLYGKARR